MTFEIAPAEAENIAGSTWRGVPVEPALGPGRSVTSAFGWRPPMVTPDGTVIPAGHRGIDIGMPVGTQLYAPDDGWVYRLEAQDAGGNVLWLAHGPEYNGIGIPPVPTHITLYAHLRELPDFQSGRVIGRGEPIALSGNSGKWTTGPHLHFGVWVPRNPARPDLAWDPVNPARFDQLNAPKPWPPTLPHPADTMAEAEYIGELAQALFGGRARLHAPGDPATPRLEAQGWRVHAHEVFAP